MLIIHHNSFKRDFKHIPKHIEQKFHERISIFAGNQFAPELQNHKLNGKYADCRSINITGDIRVIYYLKDDVVVLFAIGSHSELYG